MKTVTNRILFFILMIFLSFSLVAQDAEESTNFSGEPVYEVEILNYRDGTMERYDKALRLYLKGAYEDSLVVCNDVLSYDPTCLEAKWLLANAYKKTGQLGLMLDVFEEIGVREASESQFAQKILSEGSKGYLLSYDEGSNFVSIDLNESDYIYEKDRFVVYEENMILEHPITLEILNVNKREVATIEVTQVFPNYSIAKVVAEPVEAPPIARGMRLMPEVEFKQYEEKKVSLSDASGTSAKASGMNYKIVSFRKEMDGIRISDAEGFNFDGAGNIVVSDTGNNRVVKLNSRNDFDASIGSQGSGSDEFEKPTSISYFADKIVISEQTNHRLHILNSDMTNSDTVGSKGIRSTGKFNLPSKSIVDGEKLFVLDAGNKRIQVYGNDMKVEKYAISSRQIKDVPTSFAIKPGSEILVLDYISNQIHVFDINDKSELRIVELPDYLSGKSISDIEYFSKGGNDYLIFLLDKENRVIISDYDLKKEVKSIGKKGARVGQFSEPVTVKYKNDSLYILERSNNRIQIIRNFL